MVVEKSLVRAPLRRFIDRSCDLCDSHYFDHIDRGDRHAFAVPSSDGDRSIDRAQAGIAASLNVFLINSVCSSAFRRLGSQVLKLIDCEPSRLKAELQTLFHHCFRASRRGMKAPQENSRDICAEFDKL